jgi:predicted  nucleic acid-binding Zn-ribbon protein
LENISPVKHTLVDLRTPTNQLTAIKSRMLTNSERGSLMTLRNHQVINDYKQICE